LEYKWEAQENSIIDLDKKIEDKIYDKILGNEQLQVIKQNKAHLIRNSEEQNQSKEKENDQQLNNKPEETSSKEAPSRVSSSKNDSQKAHKTQVKNGAKGKTKSKANKNRN
jgi:hypothetical protein